MPKAWGKSQRRSDPPTTYDKLLQISTKVPAMNSFCLYLKISVLLFMNKALKIQPSIYWGRLPQPTPPGTSCSINCIYHPVNVLVNVSTFLSDAHVNFLIRQTEHDSRYSFSLLLFKKRSISLSNQLNQHFPHSRVHFSRYFLAEKISINKLIILRWSTSATTKQNETSG